MPIVQPTTAAAGQQGHGVSRGAARVCLARPLSRAPPDGHVAAGQLLAYRNTSAKPPLAEWRTHRKAGESVPHVPATAELTGRSLLHRARNCCAQPQLTTHSQASQGEARDGAQRNHAFLPTSAHLPALSVTRAVAEAPWTRSRRPHNGRSRPGGNVVTESAPPVG